MKEYDPKDWYWRVAGRENEVFSSARGVFVPVKDAAFVAWAEDGTPATPVNTAQEIGASLAPFLVRPIDEDVLDGYRAKHADDTIDAVQSKWLFNHENRLRAVERALGINGSPANLSPTQARAAVKALM